MEGSLQAAKGATQQKDLAVSEMDGFPALCSWATLRSIGANQYCVLAGPKFPAHRTEDPGCLDDLEETFRDLRKRLRLPDLVPGSWGPADDAEARRKEREINGQQTPFAQYA